ncbi:hypothetical protein GQ55_3G027700 [Panicum hallii var. hallii]|uniref:RING-type domain-containing protein n=1 Tax=Panicum hallii var. hallii TaxID=1504633 RepID=A0A2T7E559_9POAL|nr:hypothetical protein GQ55_3G027700 [Panicum hallii var. hallii]
MADESFEDGLISTSMAGSGAQQRLFEGPEQQDQFDEATRVLVEQGHHGLVQRVLVILQQPQFDEAMRVLNDDEEHDGGLADDQLVLDEFCRLLTGAVFRMLDAGYDEHDTFQVLHLLVLLAAREAPGFLDYESQPNSDGGFGAVPAPDAAVARLEKRTFRAGGDGGGGVTECSICFGDFVDGEEVSVMPCPLRGHEFHPECITKWLGTSNTCPLCRHGLAC